MKLSFFLVLVLALVSVLFSSLATSVSASTEQVKTTERFGGQYLFTECSSEHHRPRKCNVAGNVGYLTLVRQHSKSACVEGVSYFKGYRSVIVTNGCRATFRYLPVPVSDDAMVYNLITCESTHFRPQVCQIDGFGEMAVLLVARRLSHAHCTRGKSFFNKGTSVLVTHGCRAVFLYGKYY